MVIYTVVLPAAAAALMLASWLVWVLVREWSAFWDRRRLAILRAATLDFIEGKRPPLASDRDLALETMERASLWGVLRGAGGILGKILKADPNLTTPEIRDYLIRHVAKKYSKDLIYFKDKTVEPFGMLRLPLKEFEEALIVSLARSPGPLAFGVDVKKAAWQVMGIAQESSEEDRARFQKFGDEEEIGRILRAAVKRDVLEGLASYDRELRALETRAGEGEIPPDGGEPQSGGDLWLKGGSLGGILERLEDLDRLGWIPDGGQEEFTSLEQALMSASEELPDHFAGSDISPTEFIRDGFDALYRISQNVGEPDAERFVTLAGNILSRIQGQSETDHKARRRLFEALNPVSVSLSPAPLKSLFDEIMTQFDQIQDGTHEAIQARAEIAYLASGLVKKMDVSDLSGAVAAIEERLSRTEDAVILLYFGQALYEALDRAEEMPLLKAGRQILDKMAHLRVSGGESEGAPASLTLSLVGIARRIPAGEWAEFRASLQEGLETGGTKDSRKAAAWALAYLALREAGKPVPHHETDPVYMGALQEVFKRSGDWDEVVRILKHPEPVAVRDALRDYAVQIGVSAATRIAAPNEPGPGAPGTQPLWFAERDQAASLGQDAMRPFLIIGALAEGILLLYFGVQFFKYLRDTYGRKARMEALAKRREMISRTGMAHPDDLSDVVLRLSDRNAEVRGAALRLIRAVLLNDPGSMTPSIEPAILRGLQRERFQANRLRLQAISEIIDMIKLLKEGGWPEGVEREEMATIQREALRWALQVRGLSPGAERVLEPEERGEFKYRAAQYERFQLHGEEPVFRQLLRLGYYAARRALPEYDKNIQRRIAVFGPSLAALEALSRADADSHKIRQEHGQKLLGISMRRVEAAKLLPVLIRQIPLSIGPHLKESLEALEPLGDLLARIASERAEDGELAIFDLTFEGLEGIKGNRYVYGGARQALARAAAIVLLKTEFPQWVGQENVLDALADLFAVSVYENHSPSLFPAYGDLDEARRILKAGQESVVISGLEEYGKQLVLRMQPRVQPESPAVDSGDGLWSMRPGASLGEERKTYSELLAELKQGKFALNVTPMINVEAGGQMARVISELPAEQLPAAVSSLTSALREARGLAKTPLEDLQSWIPTAYEWVAAKKPSLEILRQMVSSLRELLRSMEKKKGHDSAIEAAAKAFKVMAQGLEERDLPGLLDLLLEAYELIPPGAILDMHCEIAITQAIEAVSQKLSNAKSVEKTIPKLSAVLEAQRGLDVDQTRKAVAIAMRVPAERLPGEMSVPMFMPLLTAFQKISASYAQSTSPELGASLELIAQRAPVERLAELESALELVLSAGTFSALPAISRKSLGRVAAVFFLRREAGDFDFGSPEAGNILDGLGAVRTALSPDESLLWGEFGDPEELRRILKNPDARLIPAQLEEYLRQLSATAERSRAAAREETRPGMTVPDEIWAAGAAGAGAPLASALGFEDSDPGVYEWKTYEEWNDLELLEMLVTDRSGSPEDRYSMADVLKDRVDGMGEDELLAFRDAVLKRMRSLTGVEDISDQLRGRLGLLLYRVGLDLEPRLLKPIEKTVWKALVRWGQGASDETLNRMAEALLVSLLRGTAHEGILDQVEEWGDGITASLAERRLGLVLRELISETARDGTVIFARGGDLDEVRKMLKSLDEAEVLAAIETYGVQLRADYQRRAARSRPAPEEAEEQEREKPELWLASSLGARREVAPEILNEIPSEDLTFTARVLRWLFNRWPSLIDVYSWWIYPYRNIFKLDLILNPRQHLMWELAHSGIRLLDILTRFYRLRPIARGDDYVGSASYYARESAFIARLRGVPASSLESRILRLADLLIRMTSRPDASADAVDVMSDIVSWVPKTTDVRRRWMEALISVWNQNLNAGAEANTLRGNIGTALSGILLEVDPAEAMKWFETLASMVETVQGREETDNQKKERLLGAMTGIVFQMAPGDLGRAKAMTLRILADIQGVGDAAEAARDQAARVLANSLVSEVDLFFTFNVSSMIQLNHLLAMSAEEEGGVSLFPTYGQLEEVTRLIRSPEAAQNPQAFADYEQQIRMLYERARDRAGEREAEDPADPLWLWRLPGGASLGRDYPAMSASQLIESLRQYREINNDDANRAREAVALELKKRIRERGLDAFSGISLREAVPVLIDSLQDSSLLAKRGTSVNDFTVRDNIRDVLHHIAANIGEADTAWFLETVFEVFGWMNAWNISRKHILRILAGRMAIELLREARLPFE
ncbi:MAG: hypothetical protein HY714_04255, partial [Candidatus Omnitrophica bacterium]|nr:hypothetical protein [Candidatus Omnitrophota bacterium]